MISFAEVVYPMDLAPELYLCQRINLGFIVEKIIVLRMLTVYHSFHSAALGTGACVRYIP